MLQNKSTTIISEVKDFFTSSEKATLSLVRVCNEDATTRSSAFATRMFVSFSQ